MSSPLRFLFPNFHGPILFFCLIFVFVFLPSISEEDSAQDNWLDVLEHAVQRHDGKLWISKDSRGVSNLDGMIQEFTYLKAVIDRFERHQALGIEGEWPNAQQWLKSHDPLFSH